VDQHSSPAIRFELAIRLFRVRSSSLLVEWIYEVRNTTAGRFSAGQFALWRAEQVQIRLHSAFRLLLAAFPNKKHLPRARRRA